MGSMTKIPKGTHIARRNDGTEIPDEEAIETCKTCGATYDLRDLADVFAHFDLVHGRPQSN